MLPIQPQIASTGACLLSLAMGVWTCLMAADANSALHYQTRMESVEWQADGSKFFCRLSHPVDGFGEAIFEREAGERTRFYLNSKMPRMKTGKAALITRSPAWLPANKRSNLAMVAVKESMTPISIGRSLSERMLAELEKGMLLDFKRQPLYGDPQAIQVTLSSIGFRQGHQHYLKCLSDLLPRNFKQIEKSSLYYGNDDETLTPAVTKRLDEVVAYVNEDEQVKVFYLDGHTDSEGIRRENLLKSQQRTERVVKYLMKKGIAKERIIARWHGERYPVASNRKAKGRAKNRRVTLKVSKSMPKPVEKAGEADMPAKAMEKADAPTDPPPQ